MPKKGRPGPRPHCWKVGPDELLHRKYRQFLQQKNQAQFRKEVWLLTFEEWCLIWGDLFLQRGRKPYQYCMTRQRALGPWDKDNAIILTRREHLQLRNAGKFASNIERDY